MGDEAAGEVAWAGAVVEAGVGWMVMVLGILAIRPGFDGIAVTQRPARYLRASA